MKSKVAKVFAVVIILTIILFAAIQIYFSPTPIFRRNNSMNGVKVNIQVSNDERKPIVRTFEREEFESLPRVRSWK